MVEQAEPLASRSVQEQSLYLLVRACDKCQSGPLEEISRSQSAKPTGLEDHLSVRCSNCGHESVLDFARPAIETTLSKSELIDVAEWLALCHHFMDLAQTNSQQEQSHEQIVSARYCLNEALKFYPKDSHLPSPSAFFGRLGSQRFKDHPAVFLKTKLLDLRRRLASLAGQSSGHERPEARKKRKWWRGK